MQTLDQGLLLNSGTKRQKTEICDAFHGLTPWALKFQMIANFTKLTLFIKTTVL
jgi:hypothetical protein